MTVHREDFIYSALAPSTRKAYDSGWRTFASFQVFKCLPPIEVMSDVARLEVLILFTTQSAVHLSLSYSTIKLYIWGIKYNCMQATYCKPSGIPEWSALFEAADVPKRN